MLFRDCDARALRIGAGSSRRKILEPLDRDDIHRFDRDTALSLVEAEERNGETVHVFDARIDDGWWIVAGPNGGYLSTILLRGMVEAVNDPVREPRTQTTHYTARAIVGPARLTTRIVRQGRSLSTVTARLEQEGQLIAYSIGALGGARDTRGHELEFQDILMPEVPPPDRVEVAPAPTILGTAFSFGQRYEKRPIFGSPEPSPRAEAVTGGWLRLLPNRGGDALLLTAIADGWPPAIFHKQPPGPESRGVPTVELTVHFRSPVAASTVAPGEHYLVRFTTRTSRDGFLEEDGEIWSERGVLLAQSRQLALLA
jgi:acyl-CoA thioesterase